MEKKHNIVYQITNLINGDFYIGVHSTNDLNDNYKGSGTILRHAYKKYGRENFKFEIRLECDSKEHAYYIEKMIVNNDFISRRDTYNIKVGGYGGGFKGNNLGKKHSEEAKEKNRVAHLGKKLTPEHIEKCRIANTGRICLEETKEKIRKANIIARNTRNFSEKFEFFYYLILGENA